VKAAPAADPEEAKAEPEKEEKKTEARPAWDDEGFGKMTLAEYEKVKAAKDAELLAKLGPLGPKETRKIENVDLKNFSYKENADAKDRLLAERKAAEKKKNQQRAGQKPLELTEFFAVKGAGRGGAGGGRGRGGFQGDRPPREGQAERQPREEGEDKQRRGGYQGPNQHKVPSGAKQFPDLVPQTVSKSAPTKA